MLPLWCIRIPILETATGGKVTSPRSQDSKSRDGLFQVVFSDGSTYRVPGRGGRKKNYVIQRSVLPVLTLGNGFISQVKFMSSTGSG